MGLTSLSILYPNFPCGNKQGKASCSQNVSLKTDVGCFPSPGAILISSPVNKFGTNNVSWKMSSAIPLGPGISSLANDNKLLGI